MAECQCRAYLTQAFTLAGRKVGATPRGLLSFNSAVREPIGVKAVALTPIVASVRSAWVTLPFHEVTTG